MESTKCYTLVSPYYITLIPRDILLNYTNNSTHYKFKWCAVLFHVKYKCLNELLKQYRNTVYMKYTGKQTFILISNRYFGYIRTFFEKLYII